MTVDGGGEGRSSRRPPQWRLFVALSLDPAAVRHLGVATSRAAERVVDLPGAANLRWTPAARVHLTVQFLGATDTGRLPGLRRACEQAASSVPPFSWHLAGSAANPSVGRARVIFSTAVSEGQALDCLHVAVHRAIRRTHLRLERRRFAPHVTIARVRHNRPMSPDVVPSVLEELTGYEGPPQVASRIELVRSHLGPRPEYEVLQAWPLAGSRDVA